MGQGPIAGPLTCGEGGIRTPGTLSSAAVLETAALNHSSHLRFGRTNTERTASRMYEVSCGIETLFFPPGARVFRECLLIPASGHSFTSKSKGSSRGSTFLEPGFHFFLREHAPRFEVSL